VSDELEVPGDGELDDGLGGSSDAETPVDDVDGVANDEFANAGGIANDEFADADGVANDDPPGAPGEVDPPDQPSSPDADVEASEIPGFEADVAGGIEADGLAAADMSDARAVEFGMAAVPDEEPLGGDVRPEDLLDLRLNVWAELGRTELPAAEVVRLPQGAILELDRLPDDPADLFVNGTLLGRGRLIELDGEWAVRIESLELPSDGIEQASSETSAG
jgi:flagellar motor switch protein FliN